MCSAGCLITHTTAGHEPEGAVNFVKLQDWTPTDGLCQLQVEKCWLISNRTCSHTVLVNQSNFNVFDSNMKLLTVQLLLYCLTLLAGHELFWISQSNYLFLEPIRLVQYRIRTLSMLHALSNFVTHNITLQTIIPSLENAEHRFKFLTANYKLPQFM